MLDKQEQHFGPWLKAAPFLASRKAFLSVPGFYASKKTNKKGQEQAGPQQRQASPLLAASESPPTLSPRNQETELSSKSLDHDVNFASNSSKRQSTTDTEFSEPPFLAHPTKYTPQVNFDQLIADIDKDIRCFDIVDPACKIPSKLHLGRSQLDDKGPNTVKDTPTSTLAKPTDPSPLTLCLVG